MRKPLIALASGVAVFALVAAGAASLTVNGAVPAAGTGSGACDTAVNVSYELNSAATTVTGVTVSDIDTACADAGANLLVAVGSESAEVTVDTASETVTFETPIAVADAGAATVTIGNFSVAVVTP